MLDLGIALFVSAIVAIAIFYIISIWVYKRAPANMGFYPDGFNGHKSLSWPRCDGIARVSRGYMGFAGDDQVDRQPNKGPGCVDVRQNSYRHFS